MRYMGILETEARKRRNKDYVQKAVLSAIGIAGILALTAVAPNTLQILGKIGLDRRFTYRTRSVLSRLVAKGHIRFVNERGKKHVEITPAGKRALALETHLSTFHSSKKPWRWDKRWRMVMFDIPEPRKRDRDRLRLMMTEVGFVCFQDSVWVFPYDCEDFVALLKIDMRLGNAVRYAIVEKLENDALLRRHFKLS